MIDLYTKMRVSARRMYDRYTRPLKVGDAFYICGMDFGGQIKCIYQNHEYHVWKSPSHMAWAGRGCDREYVPTQYWLIRIWPQVFDFMGKKKPTTVLAADAVIRVNPGRRPQRALRLLSGMADHYEGLNIRRPLTVNEMAGLKSELEDAGFTEIDR